MCEVEMATVFRNNNFVTLAVLQSVKDDLERAFQGRINLFSEELKKSQRQWHDLKLKVGVLERELRSSRDEVGTLRSALITETQKREEEEQKNQRLTEIMESLMMECVRLEEKIAEFEERPVGPQAVTTPDNTVLDSLNEHVRDTKSNFEKMNGRQTKIEEEVVAMKQVMKQLTAPGPPPSTTASPVNDNCNQIMLEEQTYPLSPASSSPPMLSPAHSPVLPPPPEENEFILDCQSPPPSPNSAPAPNTEPANIPVPKKNKRGRDPRWDQEHGVDPANPSGKSCLCGSTFNSKSYTSKHIFYFTKKWQFPCQFCKKPFLSYTTLRKHLQSVHDVMSIAGEENRVGCRLCGAVLKTRLQLKNHLRLVHGTGLPSSTTTASGRADKAKPVQPSTSCAAGVQKLTSLSRPRTNRRKRCSSDTQHGIDHARTLHCLCGRKFSGSVTLMRHFTYHTKQTYLCRFCDKRFAYKCYLKAHTARFHKLLQVKQERVEFWNHE